MPQPPTIFPKLHVSSRSADRPSAPSTLVAFPNFGSSQLAADTNPHQQVFRTKRKHVLKACDRCRVKKTKCDGNQPCYRCASHNHPCLFRERKITQTKAYSRGFVEMLESHHALVVKALQQLYAHCINNKCFPGEPIDSVDGYPLTHAILDRLGLIKEAEESTSDALDDDATEALRYWKFHRRSSSSADTEDTSSVQTSPIEQSPVSESGSGSSASEPNGMNGDHSFARLQDAYTPYGPYPCADEQLWSMAATPASPLAMDFNQTIATTGLHAGSRYLPAHVSDPTKIAHQDPSIPSSSVRNPSMIVPSGSCQPPSFHQLYTVAPVFSYQHPNDGLSGADQQDVWAPNPWNRSKNGQNSNLGRP